MEQDVSTGQWLLHQWVTLCSGTPAYLGNFRQRSSYRSGSLGALWTICRFHCPLFSTMLRRDVTRAPVAKVTGNDYGSASTHTKLIRY